MGGQIAIGAGGFWLYRHGLLFCPSLVGRMGRPLERLSSSYQRGVYCLLAPGDFRYDPDRIHHVSVVRLLPCRPGVRIAGELGHLRDLIRRPRRSHANQGARRSDRAGYDHCLLPPAYQQLENLGKDTLAFWRGAVPIDRNALVYFGRDAESRLSPLLFLGRAFWPFCDEEV